MIAPVIVSALTASAPITAMIGNRIRPGVSPQYDTYPQIIYKISDTGTDGDPCYNSETGPFKAQVEIYIYGRTYNDIDTLANLVTAALNNFGPATVAGTYVQGVWLDSASDDVVYEADSEKILYYEYDLNFEVHYTGA